MSQKNLLEVRNLTKVYVSGMRVKKAVIAIDNITFNLPGDKPHITALVGESGSGKTTTLRLILGFIKPTSGEILYKGINIMNILHKNQAYYRREVQAVFQDPYSIYNPFYKVDRVLESVINKFNLAQGQEVKSLIEETLKSIGLRSEDVLGRYPHQISGGERQRLMLARVLLMKPRLILADEPVSMIDVSLRAIFLDILMDFKKKYGISTLYITHDFNVANYIADDGIVLCSGNMVEKGPIKELVKNPFHPYTKGLIESIPRPDPTKRWPEKIELKVESLEKRMQKGACAFYGRCPDARKDCSEKRPSMIEISKNHEVACFHYT
jgi:peptide/nickel transport system ATP-binding protein